MDNDFVIYREGYAGKKLEWIREKTWDDYFRDTPNTVCVEVSRGHTITEAINLTMLANGQKEIEHE